MQSATRTLLLEGSPKERGKIHGQTLKPIISEAIEIWKNNLQKLTGMNPDKYVDQFIEETDFLAAVEKWTPHLLEEVEGIGEGAGVDFNTIFAWQCVDEEWWYRTSEKMLDTNARGLYAEAETCSALGCLKEGNLPALLAQNLDLPKYYDGFQVLLRIKHPDSSLESFVYTIAGIIGANGLNKQPLGVCVNTLLDLNHAADGLPVAFIVRSVLEQKTLDKATEFIHRIKHASGQNYVIEDSERVVDFECSANKVSEFVVDEGLRRVYHTNHALANDDKVASAEEIVNKSTTLARFSVLESRLKDPSKTITVETIKSILSSHEGPICAHNERSFTSGSLIISLSTPPELHLAWGPPCSKNYETFRF